MTTGGGGNSVTATNTNPSVELTGFIPRALQGTNTITGTLNTLTTISVYDSGMFLSTPTAQVIGGAVTTIASITWGLGGKPDNVLLQPL